MNKVNVGLASEMSAEISIGVDESGWWQTGNGDNIGKRRYAGTKAIRTCWTKPAGEQSQPQPQPGWLRKEAVRLEAESWPVTWAWGSRAGLEGCTDGSDFAEVEGEVGGN